MAASRSTPRPLDMVRSIKVKLGLVVVGSVAATVGAIFVFLTIGAQARFAFAGGLVVSLLVIQVLAHGMVLPLREMVAATRGMANGDYDQRVTATAKDEVGTVARSFNTMASQLGEAERQRRELVTNVCHDLRTPIAALRARLENLADGVEPLDDDAVAAMLKATERLARLVDWVGEDPTTAAAQGGTGRSPTPGVEKRAVAAEPRRNRGQRLSTGKDDGNRRTRPTG